MDTIHHCSLHQQFDINIDEDQDHEMNWSETEET